MGTDKNIKLHIVTDIKTVNCCQYIMDIGVEHMSRYVTPVNPAVYPHLTLLLLGIGIFFTAWFFVYEVTSTKYTRDVQRVVGSFVCSFVYGIWYGFPFVMGRNLCVNI